MLSTFCIAIDKMEDERTPNITPKLATDNKKTKKSPTSNRTLVDVDASSTRFRCSSCLSLAKSKKNEKSCHEEYETHVVRGYTLHRMNVPWFIASGNIHDTQSGVGVCRNHELVRT